MTNLVVGSSNTPPINRPIYLGDAEEVFNYLKLGDKYKSAFRFLMSGDYYRYHKIYERKLKIEKLCTK